MPTKRILIVDDERLARISLADFLREANYDTISVSDGESALRLQQEQAFDLCIVDIRMPGLNGVETIQALHQIEPFSRFIVYTGSPQFVMPSELKKMGLSNRHIIRKPVFDMKAFLALIDLIFESEDSEMDSTDG